MAVGLGVVVAVAAAAVYFATRSPGQPQVSADALPLAADVHRVAAYVDCSHINALDFDPHTPCESFVLLEGNHFASAALLQNAETHELSGSGWRHSASQPVDYDDGGAMASPSERWILADRDVCAYVAGKDWRGGRGERSLPIRPLEPASRCSRFLPQGQGSATRTRPVCADPSRLPSPKPRVVLGRSRQIFPVAFGQTL